MSSGKYVPYEEAKNKAIKKLGKPNPTLEEIELVGIIESEREILNSLRNYVDSRMLSHNRDYLEPAPDADDLDKTSSPPLLLIILVLLPSVVFFILMFLAVAYAS